MPFVAKGPESLIHKLHLRVTASERARLDEDAAIAGLTVSELVRRRYFGRPIVAHTDMIMIRELRRIGGLLKHIHDESGGVYAKETAEALSAVKTYIEALSQKRETDTGGKP